MEVENKDYKTLIEQFVASRDKAAWIEYAEAKLYIRKQCVVRREQLVWCLCIANIMVEEGSRRKGICRAIVNAVESFNYPVYIENAMAPELFLFFINKGYLVVENFGGTVLCFYKNGTKELHVFTCGRELHLVRNKITG